MHGAQILLVGNKNALFSAGRYFQSGVGIFRTPFSLLEPISFFGWIAPCCRSASGPNMSELTKGLRDVLITGLAIWPRLSRAT